MRGMEGRWGERWREGMEGRERDGGRGRMEWGGGGGGWGGWVGWVDVVREGEWR